MKRNKLTKKRKEKTFLGNPALRISRLKKNGEKRRGNLISFYSNVLR